MDELSTFFHCSEKSLGELINANDSGVIVFILFLYKLDFCLHKRFKYFTLRLIPLIFGILSIYIFKDILVYFVDRKTASLQLLLQLVIVQFIYSRYAKLDPTTIPISDLLLLNIH